MHEVHFLKESFHSFFVIWKITAIDKPWIPFEQNIPKVKNNSLNSCSHPMILLASCTSSNFKCCVNFVLSTADGSLLCYKHACIVYMECFSMEFKDKLHLSLK